MGEQGSAADQARRRWLPPLGALRAFEAAARRGSFKTAAAELGVTPTAISHQIRQLEATLAARLFVRATRRVTLTEDGRALLSAVRQALDMMAEAAGAIRRRPIRQVATLSATVAVAARLLVPRAARFRALNPGWDLRLHASDALVDIAGGEADAAIRYGLHAAPGLVAVPLLRDRFAPVCSPHAGIRDVEDLRRATLIHLEWGGLPVAGRLPDWPGWAEQAGAGWLKTGSGISFNDENSAIQAALAGQGVALLSTPLIGDELAAGSLIEPFGPAIDGLSYHLVHAADAADTPAVAQLRRWVLAEWAGTLMVGVE